MFPRRLGSFITILRNILCIVTIILVALIYKVTKIHKSEVVNKIPKDAMKYMDFEISNQFKNLHVNTIKRLITKYNLEEQIVNLHAYGPIREDTTILVIYLDDIYNNLKYLLVSLSQAWGIEDVLIIFSHLYFDENVNSLLQTIDFARVLQIYYPYSVQVYPHEFPGYHPNDCKHNMDINAAKAANCTSAFSPDIHGRYRDPLNAQKKHYWWWTANKVFENLTITANHRGTFIFLDKDVFVLEDFIYTTLHMKKICGFLSQCDFVSVETASYSNFYENKTWAVEVNTWDPKHHSNVLAFDSSVWNSIASHYNIFCSIDDYSWSRSLYYLSLNRRDGNRFKVMTSVLPRAYKTNYCGLYGKLLDCNAIEIVFQVMNIQIRNKDNLFPSYLEVYIDIELDYDELVIFDYVENNGGWNDPRDQKMCHDLTTHKIKRSIMNMENEFKDYKDSD